MKIITDLAEMASWRHQAHRLGLSVGLVPTMGALHQGHLALVQSAREQSAQVVVSIFVNPTQFGPREDWQRYPRTLEQDQSLLVEAGVDLLLLPEAPDIYPPHHQTTIQVNPLGQELCGHHRPGHFQGVATVVTILFHLVQPDRAFFGLKDYQQWILVNRLVQDLHLPIHLVGVPTVRESDGLAMSSRNRFLTPKERTLATTLHQALQSAHQAWQNGVTDPGLLEDVARQILERQGIESIDYVAIRDAATLAPITSATPAHANRVMLVAARVGSVRLIDNLPFNFDPQGV